MRIGILSDIHSNLEALNETLAALERFKPDTVICLGDVVGYGASVNECCALVRKVSSVTLLGNHDAAVSGRMDYSFYYDAARHALDWTAARIDLAHLEWLCEESMASRRDAALPLQALAGLPAVELGGLRLALQPSVRLMSSPYPVWSVWHANQGDADAEPVDFSLGAEHCAIACLEDRVTVYRLATGDYRLLVAIREGATLGDAMETAGVDAQKLGALLGWAFSEQLVVALEPSPTA